MSRRLKVPLSDHLIAELRAVWWRGRREGRPVPLDPGQPVPGCGCEHCTGIAPEDIPRPQRRPVPRTAGRRPALPVEDARAVSILDIARMLGLGEPEKRGREYVVHCPLHEDSRPSLRIDAERGLWYCDPCAGGGDGIELVMAVNNVDFAGAVKEIAA